MDGQFTPGPGPRCPSLEDVAAFVDGRLTGTEHESLVRHLAECETCRELVSGVARAMAEERESPSRPERRLRLGRTVGWTVGALAAAAMAMIAMRLDWTQLGRSGLQPTRGLGQLVAAVGASRPIEPRLTGGFAWGALVSPVRASAPHEASLEIRAAALEIEKTVADRPTARGRGALGSAYLVQGQAERAIEALQRAVGESPNDPQLLSDLAAAYLVRRRPDDANSALATVERALRIDPNLKEALFNRALALEELSLRAQARQAWQDYLALDRDSEWTREAQAHLDKVSTNRREEDWAALATRLQRGQTNDVARAAAEFAQETRELVEEAILPSWAAEVETTGHDAEATQLLETASTITLALSTSGGDRLPVETVRALANARSDAARRSLAQAHRLYAEGLPLYDRYEYDRAETLFRPAAAALRAEGSPFALWVDLHLAVIDYQHNRIERAARSLEWIAREARAGSFLSLVGRAQWVLSLADSARGRLVEADRRLDLAFHSFEVNGEMENAAAVAAIKAQSALILGEPVRSWTYEREALARLDAVRRVTRRQAVLHVAALIASQQGLPEGALHYLDEFVATAGDNVSAGSLADIQIQRARAHARLGDQAAARTDLSEALRCLERQADQTLRRFTEAQAALASTETEIDAFSDPVRTVAALDEAIDFFATSGRTVFLPRAYLQRGRQRAHLEQRGEAERDYTLGIDAFERQQAGLRKDHRRAAFFGEYWRLFEELASLQYDRGEADKAFVTADTGRALAFAQSATSPGAGLAVADPAEVVRRLAPRQTVVCYLMLRDRWLAWVLSAAGVHVVEQRTPSGEIEDRVREFRELVDRRDDPSRVRLAAAALFDEIIAPLYTLIEPNSTLVIIPDGPLYQMPFGALFDRARGTYLVEEHAVLLTPSVTFALTAPDRDSMRPRPETALVIGAPAIRIEQYPDLAALPDAEHEAREVAAIYPGAEVIVGAEATRDRFLASVMQRDVVHFAGHTIANGQNPGYSSLLFAPDSEDQRGVPLFATEIEDLAWPHPARTRLVVLAACGTALGVTYRGEGPISLVRSFLTAGVPAVVASFWDVDDQTSRTLLRRFHQEFRTGSAVADALRRAQVEVIKGTPYPSIAQWAGFAAFGAAEPVAR